MLVVFSCIVLCLVVRFIGSTNSVMKTESNYV